MPLQMHCDLRCDVTLRLALGLHLSWVACSSVRQSEPWSADLAAFGGADGGDDLLP
jgi:hypothetical protein